MHSVLLVVICVCVYVCDGWGGIHGRGRRSVLDLLGFRCLCPNQVVVQNDEPEW